MNNAQRKRLEEAIDLMDQVNDTIGAIKDEESEKFDNLPESLQGTELNKKIQEGALTLAELHYDLEDKRAELYNFLFS